MKNSIIQKHAPVLWIVAGVLFLLPSVFGSSNSQTSVGVGMMFIIFGIVFFRKKKSDTSPSKKP
jgi:LPXTG-motif cell wall-anchored protein